MKTGRARSLKILTGILSLAAAIDLDLFSGLHSAGRGPAVCVLPPASECAASSRQGFADYLAVCTATPTGMQKILGVIARFCQRSEMRLNMARSVITAFDYGRRTELPTNGIRYNGEILVCLPGRESFRYLGVRTALSGGLRGASPNTADEIQHVKSSTKELTQRLAGHQMPSMRAVATAWFRYSAALTPWTDYELGELFKFWMQVEKAAWELQRGFSSAQFQLTTDHGGAPPRVVLIQALTTHVLHITALPDELRETCIRSYRKLCVDCGPAASATSAN